MKNGISVIKFIKDNINFSLIVKIPENSGIYSEIATAGALGAAGV
jgi:hypothetical protein